MNWEGVQPSLGPDARLNTMVEWSVGRMDGMVTMVASSESLVECHHRLTVEIIQWLVESHHTTVGRMPWLFVWSGEYHNPMVGSMPLSVYATITFNRYISWMPWSVEYIGCHTTDGCHECHGRLNIINA